MSNYVRNPVVKCEFDGDSITVVLTPIEFAERLAIEDAMPFQDDTPEVRDVKHLDCATKSRVALRAHMKELTGLRDLAGVDIGIDEMFRDSYFENLVATIFRAWWKMRKPENPKAPASSSTGSSEGSPSQPPMSTDAKAG